MQGTARTFLEKGLWLKIGGVNVEYIIYEGWNFNSGNYLFTTDTK